MQIGSLSIISKNNFSAYSYIFFATVGCVNYFFRLVRSCNFFLHFLPPPPEIQGQLPVSNAKRISITPFPSMSNNTSPLNNPSIFPLPHARPQSYQKSCFTVTYFKISASSPRNFTFSQAFSPVKIVKTSATPRTNLLT